jgi:hypothetical protein
MANSSWKGDDGEHSGGLVYTVEQVRLEVTL